MIKRVCLKGKLFQLVCIDEQTKSQKNKYFNFENNFRFFVLILLFFFCQIDKGKNSKKRYKINSCVDD